MDNAPEPSTVSVGESESGPTTAASGVPRALRRRAFAPLFVVMAILISLVATPVISSTALRQHRRLISEVLDPARVAVNDLEAARASEVLATVLARSGDAGAADSLRRQSDTDTARDMETLRGAAIALGEDAIDRFITLRAVLA